MPQNNKTQKRITKLNKALGLARMKLRYLSSSGLEEAHSKGKEYGFTAGIQYEGKAIKELPFWAKVKFLFSK